MTTVAFIDNKGGLGRTSLVYHLAWMYADLGIGVVAADLDPQARLTRMFLDSRQMDDLWSPSPPRETIHGALLPLLDGTGGVAMPEMQTPRPALCLAPGDLALSATEDEFACHWLRCLDGHTRSFDVTSALNRMLRQAQDDAEADLVLIDVGPNLGAISRAALIAADHIVVPLAPDLVSMQGLRALGSALSAWRDGWRQRRTSAESGLGLSDRQLPDGEMASLGYVVLRQVARPDHTAHAYARWTDAIPSEYSAAVLRADDGHNTPVEADAHCLGVLKSYASLTPYAREARAPVFFLRASDGATGSHMNAVRDSYSDYRDLACAIADRIGVRCPQLD